MTILNINKYFFIRGGAERFFFALQKLLEKKGHKVIPFCMHHLKNFPASLCHPRPFCHSREFKFASGKLNGNPVDSKYNTGYSQYFVSEVNTEKISFSWQGLRTIARFFWSFEAARKLKKLIKQEKPKLAIVHNIYHQISPSILPVLKKNKIPVILIAHDYGLLSPNYNMLVRGKVYDKICGSKFLKCIPDRCVDNSFIKSLICGLETWFHHSVLNIYQKNIDYVITPSQFMADMFLRAGWDKDKIIHLPYFVQPTNNNQQSAKRENYILFFGRLSKEKGIDTLIEAMRDLPGIKLKIVGTGPEKENYELRIMNYGLKNIETLGYKSGQELNEIIANAKFIVVPSVWYENYPMSVLESYALGVPALVANIGGLPEMIPNQDKNFIFESGNIKELGEKINFLWQNNSIVSEAGERVKNFVKENNNPEKHYQKMTTFMLSSSRKRGSQHLQLSTES